MDVTSVNNAAQPLPLTPDPSSADWLVENRELIRSVKQVNASELFGDGNELSFALDRDTKRPVVRVVDQATGKVLWQMPPEYLLKIAQSLGQHDG